MKDAANIVPKEPCKKWLDSQQARALCDLALEGIDHECLDDADNLLELLRLACEPCPEVMFLNALVYIRREQWLEALQMLESATSTGGASPHWMHPKPFIAYCMMRLRDPGWRPIAEEVWDAGGTADDLSLVGVMLDKSRQDIEMQAQYATPVDSTPSALGREGRPLASLI